MFLPLLLLVGLSAQPADDPPVHVSLNNHARYVTGDRAEVSVKVERDGYLLVLRADAQGRVRVLFPLDPGDDDFVRGGKEFELRDRGGRDGFFVDEREGTGAVLAALSVSPFKFDEFTRNDHWDYRVLANDLIRTDPEAGLIELVRRMAGEERFDYDVGTYVVSETTYGRGRYAYRPYGYYDPFDYPCFGCGYPGSSFRFSIGFGWGWPYRSRYGFGCDPFFYDPFCYRNSFVFYRPRLFYPYGYSYRFSDPRAGSRRWSDWYRPGGPPFVLKSPRTMTRFTGWDVRRRNAETGWERDRTRSVQPAPRPRGESASPPPRMAPPRRESPSPRASPPPRAAPPPSRSGGGGERHASPPPSRGSAGGGQRPSNGGGRRH